MLLSAAASANKPYKEYWDSRGDTWDDENKQCITLSKLRIPAKTKEECPAATHAWNKQHNNNDKRVPRTKKPEVKSKKQ